VSSLKPRETAPLPVYQPRKLTFQLNEEQQKPSRARQETSFKPQNQAQTQLQQRIIDGYRSELQSSKQLEQDYADLVQKINRLASARDALAQSNIKFAETKHQEELN